MVANIENEDKYLKSCIETFSGKFIDYIAQLQ